MNFLNEPSKDKLIFTMGTGNLVPMPEIPNDLNNKLAYFLKLDLVQITESNYKFILVNGEISINPIQDLKVVAENVSYKCIIYT